MKKIRMSIKWQLMAICVFLVVVPVVVLGLLSYRSVSQETMKEIEESLGQQSLDWQIISESYAGQIEGVLEREDQLIRQHVAAISLDVKKMMELTVETYGPTPPRNVVEDLYDKIASIKVGQTGYVYLIDKDGNYVVSKDRLRDGENIWMAEDSDGRYFIQEMVNEGRLLKGDGIYPIDYPWKNIGETAPRMKLAGIAYFEPWDLIIGASSYYSDFRSADLAETLKESLKTRIAQEQIGETGYIWVVNSAGEYIVSKDRIRDGENIWEAKDADGVFFIQVMVEEAKKKAAGEFYIHYYPWQNTGETRSRMKLAAVTYVPEFDWVIGPSAYHEEFMGGLFRIRNLTILICAIAVGAGILISLFFSIRIARPLSAATNLADELAQGNFQVQKLKVKSRNEIGVVLEAFGRMIDVLKYKADIINKYAGGDFSQSIDLASDNDKLGRSLLQMRNSLNDVLMQVNAAVDQVTSGSDQVAQSSQSLSQGASEQASSLEEISSSLNEINSQARQNAENASQASALATAAVEKAEAGNERMKDLRVAMTKINDSSDEIKKIVKVIDDIAFQINLLALNANVEAARAGKWGKGFAVVAEEVRNLAVRSGSAVSETTAMVEESIKNIDQGTQLAESTGTQLEEIVQGSNKVADFLGEIALASKEQAQGVEQINGGLEQIDQVTQSNTASAEQSASAAEELAAQGQELKGLIARFTLSDDDGGSGRAGRDRKMDFSAADNGAQDKDFDDSAPADAPVFTAAKTAEDKKTTTPVNPKDVIKLDDDDFGQF